MWDLSSLTRDDQTNVPCIARWILNHWTTKEVPVCVCVCIYKYSFNSFYYLDHINLFLPIPNLYCVTLHSNKEWEFVWLNYFISLKTTVGLTLESQIDHTFPVGSTKFATGGRVCVHDLVAVSFQSQKWRILREGCSILMWHQIVPLLTGIYGSGGFPGGSAGKSGCLQCGRLGLDPWVWKIPGEGNGNPLQYSCLENPMDRGAWQATVHGVAKGRTRLSNFTSLHFTSWKWEQGAAVFQGTFCILVLLQSTDSYRESCNSFQQPNFLPQPFLHHLLCAKKVLRFLFL